MPKANTVDRVGYREVQPGIWIGRHAHVRWHWVKGHETGAQHAHKVLNDRADQLAVAAALEQKNAA